MMGMVLFSLVLFFQSDPPFKAKEDFEIKFDLSFKQRSQLDSKMVNLNETEGEKQRRTNTTPLPYLKLHIRIISVSPDEVKVKVIKDDASTVLNKKIVNGMEFDLEIGYRDDIVDMISGNKHVIQFLSTDKKVMSIILIEFDDEGNYSVNGEKRGKI